MKSKNLFHLHDRCGHTKDAADFAIVLTVRPNKKICVVQVGVGRWEFFFFFFFFFGKLFFSQNAYIYFQQLK